MAKFCSAPRHIVSETPDTANFTKVIIISQMDDRNRYSMNNVKQNFQQNVNLREDKPAFQFISSSFDINKH